MFDIGFWELCLIAIAALLVVGPKRLPRIAYETGLWFGRLQRFLRKARMDIERELHQYEIKQTLEEQKRELEQVRQMAEDGGKELYRGLKSLEAGEEQVREESSGGASSERSPKSSNPPERKNDE